MEETTQNSKSRLETRLNEARVYRSMGLFDESLEVYARILDEFPGMPDHNRARIQEQIEQIRDEIAERNGDDAQAGLSAEQLSLIQEEFSDGEDPEDVLARATAFLEIGQHREALEAFRRLLETDFPVDRILGNLVACLLRLYGPDETPEQLENLSSETSLGKRERARLKFKLGVELENLGHIDEAIASYRTARGIIPEDLNMRSALDAKIAALSKGSRYAYLLNQGWVSEEDLDEAGTQARSTGASLEAVLMEQFGITKQEIGRSLSNYYDLPFKSYEPNTTAPVDVLTRLDRADLIQECWVPVSAYKREADVLMEDPGDTARVERIRALLSMDSLSLAVGFREDVQAYIDRYFEALDLAQKTAAAPRAEAGTGPARKPRRERRFVPSIPDFSYVEFFVEGKDAAVRLEVLNASEHGIGLLLPKEHRSIADGLQPGSVIPGMTFYAPWTLIRADAKVRHVTRITRGRYTGHYLLGVESEEIIESSKVPD